MVARIAGLPTSFGAVVLVVVLISIWTGNDDLLSTDVRDSAAGSLGARSYVDDCVGERIPAEVSAPPFSTGAKRRWMGILLEELMFSMPERLAEPPEVDPCCAVGFICMPGSVRMWAAAGRLIRRGMSLRGAFAPRSPCKVCKAMLLSTTDIVLVRVLVEAVLLFRSVHRLRVTWRLQMGTRRRLERPGTKVGLLEVSAFQAVVVVVIVRRQQQSPYVQVVSKNNTTG